MVRNCDAECTDGYLSGRAPQIRWQRRQGFERSFERFRAALRVSFELVISGSDFRGRDHDHVYEAIAGAGEIDGLLLWRLPTGRNVHTNINFGSRLRERAHTREHFKLLLLARFHYHV